METIFYYFLKRSIDNTCIKQPYPTLDYLGDIGDFCTIDGVGYYIVDYTIEVAYVGE